MVRTAAYIGALLTLALVVLILCSCGIVVSFDGHERSGTEATSTSPSLFAVGGSVEGASSGAPVRLTLNSPDPASGLAVTRDGAFTFPNELLDGQRYEVRAFAGAGEACTVLRGTGTIAAAAIVDVAVRCASSDAALAGLSVSGAILEPSFDAAIDAAKTPYRARLTVLARVAPTVTATARAPGATIRVDGVEVSSGSPSLPVPTVLGATTVDVEVTAPDHAITGTPTIRHYTVVLSAFPEVYVKGSATRTNGEFGAVAISGDTLAVGAFGDPSGASGIDGNQQDASKPFSGAVFVFRRTNGRWAQEAYIKASNSRANADFGAALALDGDTLAVGSYLESSGSKGIDGNEADTSAENAGAVYVFVRSQGKWSQEAYIKASNTRAGAYFGGAVALDRDTLAVGSANESSNGRGVDQGDQANASAPNAGAVYVFVRSAGTWAQQAWVKASNTRADAYFGGAVAVAGDTLAVGSYHESSAAIGIDGNDADASADSAGAVYVFERSANVWSQRSYIKAANTRANAEFGYALALSKERQDTLAVSSYYESSKATGVGGDPSDTSKPKAGAVYIFSRGPLAWSQQAYLKATNTRANAFFGCALALANDTLVVGSYGESSRATGINGDASDTFAPSAGAAYVFIRSAGTWSNGPYLKASNSRTNAYFGASVALSADTLAVGSAGESSHATGLDGDQADTTTPNAGAVYLFR